MQCGNLPTLHRTFFIFLYLNKTLYNTYLVKKFILITIKLYCKKIIIIIP